MSTEVPSVEFQPRPAKGGAAGGGFFHLYKPGQGYWTRLGTALGAGAVILFVAWFVFRETSVFALKKEVRYGLAAGAVAVLALVAWWLMNGPRRAQFLIDTDSEMKKVNWAGWAELIGSTRIVIFFMLMTAGSLFIFDTQFHAFFFSLRIWHIRFNGLMGLITGSVLALTLAGIGIGLIRHAETKHGKTAGTLTIAVAAVILTVWIVFAATHSLNA